MKKLISLCLIALFLTALCLAPASTRALSEDGLLEIIGIGDISQVLNAKNVAVKSVSLNQTNIELVVGKTFTLKATIKPSNATNKAVTYSTSNAKVATVSAKGVITAKGPGTCTITVKSKSGGKTAKATVKVTKPVVVTSVSLGNAEIRLGMGTSQKLNPTILPTNATNKTLVFSSSNPNIVAVNQNGVISAKNFGTCIITATSSNGKKGSVSVTVPKIQVASISVPNSQSKLSMKVGDSLTLNVTIKPADAVDKSLTFTSSNSKIATVDTKGKIVAKAKGQCNITVQSNSNKKAKLIIPVTVSEVPVSLLTLRGERSSGEYFLYVGESDIPKIEIQPSNATNKTLTYSCSNNKVAKVDVNGKITALKAGSCTITVKSSNGKKFDIKLVVEARPKTGVITWTIDSFDQLCRIYDEQGTDKIEYKYRKSGITQFDLLRGGKISVYRAADKKTWYYLFSKNGVSLSVNANAFIRSNEIKNNSIDVLNEKLTNSVNALGTKSFTYLHGIGGIRHSFDKSIEYDVSFFSQLLVSVIPESTSGVMLKCKKVEDVWIGFTKSLHDVYGNSRALVTPAEYRGALLRQSSIAGPYLGHYDFVSELRMAPSFVITVKQAGDGLTRINSVKYEGKLRYKNEFKLENLIDVAFNGVKLIPNSSGTNLKLENYWKFYKSLGTAFDVSSVYKSNETIPLAQSEDRPILKTKIKSPGKLVELGDYFEARVVYGGKYSRTGRKTLISIQMTMSCVCGSGSWEGALSN